MKRKLGQLRAYEEGKMERRSVVGPWRVFFQRQKQLTFLAEDLPLTSTLYELFITSSNGETGSKTETDKDQGLF